MKTTKRLVSFLLVFSMIASMFLTVSAVETGAKAGERTGITVERMQSADVFGEAVTHTKGYYMTDKKLEALPVTYEAWVYIPSEVYDTASGVILGTQWDIWSDTWNGAGSSDTHFSFGIRPGGHPTLVYGTNGSKQVWEATGNGVIPADKWTHVVMGHDTRATNRHVWCFIDGGGSTYFTPHEKIGKGAGLLELDSTALNNPVFLAGDGINGNIHALDSGIILGDVAVYSDLRYASAGEVWSDYTNGPDLNDPNLLLYYQISSANQNKDIKDASGHGYDMNFYRTFLTEAEMNEIRAKDKYEYDYSIAFLPDLQYMTNRFPSKLGTIFDYIIDTKEDKNLQYVVGVGDITDQDKEWEWNAVKAQYALLDAAGIPYTLVRGNHDIYTTDKVMFDETFGKDSAYYKHVAANGGFYDTSSAVNAYVRFEVGSVKYLILCLDWGIKDTAVLDWVDDVIEAHPDRRVMVTMHAWMNSDGMRFAEGDSYIPSEYNSANIDPQQMWDACFSKHSNIDMILCGHMHSDNIFATPATGTNGNLVYQILIDSQNSDLAVGSGGYNGLGLVAYMYFTEDGNHAKIEYYSTTYNRYYYEKNTEISLDFGNSNNFKEDDTPVTPEIPETPVYDNFKDAAGTVLDPYFVNDVIWDNNDGKVFLPKKPGKGFLLFDNELANNRIEATIVVKDNMGSATGYDGNKRVGLVFALTDHDGDGMFNATGTDVSYYWAFINNWGCVEVRKMGKYQCWTMIGSASAGLNTFGIDVTQGVTFAAEWDDQGHIKIYADGQIVLDVTDTTENPLTGDLYGLYAVKHSSYASNPSLVNSYYTSFVAGGELIWAGSEGPSIPDSYENCTDGEGNVLTPHFVNDTIWQNYDGQLFLPSNAASGFLLFDDELAVNRIEATIVIKDNKNGGTGADTNQRKGIVFALTDHDGDDRFTNGKDVSYYWVFVGDWGNLCLVKMAANQGVVNGVNQVWRWLHDDVGLSKMGIDVTKGVTLTAEWDDQGNIRVYANGQLAIEVQDTTNPLTGDLYGLYAVKHWNYAADPSLSNAYYTSFVAGKSVKCQVNTAVTPNEGGTVTGAGSYERGTSATVKATAAEGYKFVGWFDGNNKVSENATYTFTATENRELTAEFEKLPSIEVVTSVTDIDYAIDGNVVTVDHDLACKVGYLSGGKYVAITATPNGDGTYSFIVPEGVGEVLVVVNGDVNGDGVVNAGDYGCLNAVLQGKTTLTAEEDFAANMNGDASVNAGDYGCLNAVLLGKTSFTW